MKEFDPPSKPRPEDSTSDLMAVRAASGLAAILVREHRSHPQSPAGKARVWARIQTSLKPGPRGPNGGGGAPVPTFSSTQEPPRTVKALRAVPAAACFIVAASLSWSVFSTAPTDERIVVEPALVRHKSESGRLAGSGSSASADEGMAVIAVSALPQAKVDSAARPKVAVDTRAANEDDECTICEERDLLEVGRRGLREAQYERALAAIAKHESRFVSGQLTEERESLRIRVLAAMGNSIEAERRKNDFVRRFPDSPLFESVKRATGR